MPSALHDCVSEMQQHFTRQNGFAQKVRNSTDEVGGWLILNLQARGEMVTNTTDEVGGFFMPDLHANTPSL